MDEDDAAELMRYIEESLRHTGMDGLLEHATADIGERDEPPSRNLLHMLDLLDAEIRPHDAGTAERILGQFGEFVRTTDGHAPAGLELDLTGAHQQLFRADTIDLSAGPRLGDVLEALGQLREHLQREFGEDRWR